MKNWDDLKLILALSRYGTMHAAAKALGLSTATISRRLERCAEEVGNTLFVRRGQIWQPTMAAMPLVHLAETVIDNFPHKAGAVDAEKNLDKTLRISVPQDICMDFLTPKMPEFLSEKTGTNIDIFHEEKSIAFGEVDLALGHVEPSEGRIVRARLGFMGYRAYCAQQFVNQTTGWIEVLNADHSSKDASHEITQRLGSPRLRTTSLSCAAELVKTLPCLVFLPTHFAETHKTLVPCQREVSQQKLPIWASYHESRKLDPDVRLLMDFIKKCIAD